MTTPTEPTEPSRSVPMIPGGATLPVPGNAEFLLWLCVEIVFAIIWAASDFVNAHDFLVASTWITAAYLISRGVAKASRVLEQ
jgi:hypothetical protein